MRSEHLNICVVGCGHWGKNLVRNLDRLGRLYAVCESDVGRLDWIGSQYPSAKCYSSLEEALGDPEVDAVMLATPAQHHHGMGLAVLEAGRDLFVEKPLALDWEQGLEMVEAAEQNGRVLMVGHLLRYHPAVVKLQEILATGRLGKVEYVYSNRLSMGKVRQEENALWSFAPHDISVILTLLGQLPVQVSATGGAYLQPNVADTTVSNLLFESGSRAHIFVSWLHPYKEQRLVVIGSSQMAVFDDARTTDKLVLFDKRIETKNGALEARQTKGVPVPIEDTEPLCRECEHFIDCILHRRQPLTSGLEGVKVLQVLQACQRSLQMNGEPVQVAFAGLKKILAL